MINKHKIILIGVGLITLIIGLFSIYMPPLIGSDASWGFQAMHILEHGGGFNHLISPDINDIKKSHIEFLSWWSPGQYLVPYFFKIVFGVNDGRAMSLAITCSQLSGFAGFYCFFKKAGFSLEIAAVSVVFIMLQQLFVFPYIEYNGGEIILFAFVGWFLYGCISINYAGIKLVLFVVFSGLIGFICKSSFMWMYFAGLFCLWIRLSLNKNYLSYLKNGIWIAIPFVISITAIYLLFLSRGDNPSSSAKGWLTIASAFKLSWLMILFPASASILTNFSIDEHLNGLSNYNLFVTFSVLLIASLLSAYLVFKILIYSPKKDYQLIIAIFYTFCILFFCISYLHQAQISFEGRHLRIIGLITIPGMVYLIRNNKSVLIRVLFGFVCVCLMVMNVKDLVKGLTANYYYAQGTIGIPQNLMDKSTIDFISDLDARNKNNIIVMPIDHYTCTQGLEIENSRLINYKGDTYQGHAGSLFIFVPSNYNTFKIGKLLKSFPGYKNFIEQKISKKFLLYTAE